MSNQQNDIINDNIIDDLPYDTLKDDQAEETYGDKLRSQAYIEARTCKIFECDKERAKKDDGTYWPCCDPYHGYLFANWKIVAENWETIFKAIHDRHDIGYINEIPIGDIPVEEYIYYAN